VKADTFMLNDLMEAVGVNAQDMAVEEAALEARREWLKKPFAGGTQPASTGRANQQVA
jgi:hypothetical protein